jgi:hypothetical protein
MRLRYIWISWCPIEDFYVSFIAILQKLKAALIQIKKTEVPFQRFFVVSATKQNQPPLALKDPLLLKLQ